MAGKNNVRILLAGLALVSAGCGPARLTLPSGPGAPVSDYSTIYDSARASCESVQTLQAELGLSGRAAGQRVRGRVLAGFAAGALRLEGVAPFGTPVFILVAAAERGTLLLSRERRVVRDEPPAEILNALIGVRLGPDDLRALLSGCVTAAAKPSAGRAYGDDWLAVDLASGGSVYLRRRMGTWRIVAGRIEGLEIDYVEFQGDRPSQIVLRGPELNLAVSLNQVEINGELPRDQLTALAVPADASPLPLDELRSAGPLGR